MDKTDKAETDSHTVAGIKEAIAQHLHNAEMDESIGNLRGAMSQHAIAAKLQAQLRWEIQELEENIALRLERTREEQP